MPHHKLITILQSVSGNGYNYPAGSEQSLPAEVADRWIARGVAEPAQKPAATPDATPPVNRARKATSRKAKTAQKR